MSISLLLKLSVCFSLKQRLLFFSLFCPYFVIAAETIVDDKDYWRASFPTVKTITTAEVAEQFDDLLFVDVRPSEEYDIAHIKGAYNYSVGNALFLPSVNRLRQQFPARKIVLYCNGLKCGKSYTAAYKSQQSGLENVFVYNAGIRNWLTEHPELTVFLGEIPANTDKLITDDEYQKRLLSYEQVKDYVSSSIIIDIRDQYQRKYIPTELRVRHIPFRRLIPIIKWQKIRNQRLIFIDATGQQVRWLQYYLKSERVRNYYFLKHGVEPLATQPL